MQPDEDMSTTRAAGVLFVGLLAVAVAALLIWLLAWPVGWATGQLVGMLVQGYGEGR